MTDPSTPRVPQKLLDLLEQDRAAAAELDRMGREARKATTATQAPSAYLNQMPRTLAEAVMERALRRITERTTDPYARTQAEVALSALAELRKEGVR